MRGFEVEELLRTNDMVLISFAVSLLEEADIDHLVLDTHMSVVEGSLGVLARRILVPEEYADQARRLLTENGLAKELRSTDG